MQNKIKIALGIAVIVVFGGVALYYFTHRPQRIPPPAVSGSQSNRAGEYNQALDYLNQKDYDHARAVWEQMITEDPTDPVPYDNLGKLYLYTLKDYSKSEAYFKESLQVATTSLTPYFELHELYEYAYKVHTTAAVDILMDAAKKFPTSPDPYVFLGEYYRDGGKIPEARAAFEKALAIARAKGDLAKLAAIGSELQTVQ